LPSKEDNKIRQLLKVGDDTALEVIWDTYANDLLGVLIGLLCSRQEAEDALQELFVTIARKREQIIAADNLKPYFFGMARNIAINIIKKDQRRRQRDMQTDLWLEADDLMEDNSQQIQGALEQLPTDQRSVIVMKFFRTKSFREIGEVLEISENTASSRFRYGMAKLKTLLRGIGK
jgi:RNA polymerase sigma-70 factor, ECF subfamily